MRKETKQHFLLRYSLIVFRHVQTKEKKSVEVSQLGIRCSEVKAGEEKRKRKGKAEEKSSGFSLLLGRLFYSISTHIRLAYSNKPS